MVNNLLRNVKSNILSNMFETMINILAPLLIIPYLISCLGVNQYGEYVTLIAKSALFSVIFEMGFGMFFSKQISINRDDKKMINKLFIIFLYFKLLFALLSFFVIFYMADEFNLTQFVLYLLVVGQLLNISPIVSGLELYSVLAKLQLAGKVVMLCLVFTIDFTTYGIEKSLFIQAIVWFFNSILLITIFNFKYGITFEKVSFSFIAFVFKSSLPFYGAKLFVNIYQQSSTYLVSFFLSSELVTIYSVALQLYKVGQAVIAAIAKVLYTSTVKTKNFKFVFNMTKYSLITHLLMFPIIYLFGEGVINLVFYFESDDLYRLSLILYCSLFFVIISAYWGYPVLSAINKDNYAHIGIFLSSIAYMSAFFIYYIMGNISIYTVVYCILAADIVGMLVRVYYVNKFKSFVINR